MRAYPFLAFAASVLTACASPALPQVRSRAVDDLDCPEKLIRIQEELGGHFRAVQGFRYLGEVGQCE